MDEIGATLGIGTNSCTRTEMEKREAVAEDLRNNCGSIELAVNPRPIQPLACWFAEHLRPIIPVQLNMEAPVSKYGGARVLHQPLPAAMGDCDGSAPTPARVTIDLARLSQEALGISEEDFIVFECALGEPVRCLYAAQIALAPVAGDSVWKAQGLPDKNEEKHSLCAAGGDMMSASVTMCCVSGPRI